MGAKRARIVKEEVVDVESRSGGVHQHMVFWMKSGAAFVVCGARRGNCTNPRKGGIENGGYQQLGFITVRKGEG